MHNDITWTFFHITLSCHYSYLSNAPVAILCNDIIIPFSHLHNPFWLQFFNYLTHFFLQTTDQSNTCREQLHPSAIPHPLTQQLGGFLPNLHHISPTSSTVTWFTNHTHYLQPGWLCLSNHDRCVPVQADTGPWGHLPPSHPVGQVPWGSRRVWHHIQTWRLWAVPGGSQEGVGQGTLPSSTEAVWTLSCVLIH